MVTLINTVMLAAIAVCLCIMCDYMHHMKKWTYKRVAAITSPVWIIWLVMLVLSIMGY